MAEVIAPKPIPQKSLTQYQKIVAVMCRNQYKDWWLASDFMKPELGDLFVGYEASARLSELAKKHPDIFESRQAGKYIERRIRFEIGREWYASAPYELKVVIKQYYRGRKI